MILTVLLNCVKSLHKETKSAELNLIYEGYSVSGIPKDCVSRVSKLRLNSAFFSFSI